MPRPKPPHCPDCGEQMTFDGETGDTYRFHCPTDDNYTHVGK